MTKVLLYSGGLDSYAAAYCWAPDLLLHVDMGTKYGAIESAAIDVRRAPHGLPVTRTRLPLVEWERADKIIPLRNLFLVCVAAQYGQDIALAATAGDRVLDKSGPFAQMAGDLLSYLWREQHWTPSRAMTVQLPVRWMSKRQLLRAAVDHGAVPEALSRDTFSCYTPTTDGDECGACKPCARKWVALRANGYPALVDASEYVRRNFLPPIQSGAWDRGDAEAQDVLDALGTGV